MPRSEQIKTERYRRGDSFKSIIKSVEITPKGPDIIVSRSDNHFLYKLFEMEVPEVEDGIIDIVSISRYPGERSKIIVRSNDMRIDPVGAFAKPEWLPALSKVGTARLAPATAPVFITPRRVSLVLDI